MWRSSTRRWSQWAERCLALAGAGLLLYCASIAVEAREARSEAASIGRSNEHGVLEAGSAAFASRSGADAFFKAAAGNAAGNEARAAVIGRIEIAQLGLAAPIIGGIAAWDLRRGVGHVPGTAMPGGLGTMGLAGHRDTFFRALQNVKPQMEIRVVASDGQYRYVVDSTEVVSPEQVDVVATRQRPELSLITCYPFRYVGAAPKRFIVHAHLVSVAGD